MGIPAMDRPLSGVSAAFPGGLDRAWRRSDQGRTLGGRDGARSGTRWLGAAEALFFSAMLATFWVSLPVHQGFPVRGRRYFFYAGLPKKQASGQQGPIVTTWAMGYGFCLA